MYSDPYEIIEEMLSREKFVVVKKDVLRYESLAGVRGLLRYVEDHVPKRCLHARIVRSTVPHGIIKSITLNSSKGFLITADDVPGENQVGYAIPDQPALAKGKVRFYGEPVAIVVAEDSYAAEDLLEKVDVVVEPLPAVFDVFNALRNEVLVHDERGSNVAITAHVRKGDVSTGESESDVVVEKTYQLSPQDHAYIETEAALAIPTSDGLTIIGQSQYPHLAQRTVARVIGIPQSKVTILQAAIGGAFGGKDDMGPIVSAQAAIACWKLGKPVILQYSREESFTSHCKRDPAIIKCRTGASHEGFLKFLQAEVIFDSGAYANRGPYTLWRACVHVSGPYNIPHVDITGKLVYTNKVYQGSFRGFGNPQAQFAAERQMDELARKLGMDPVDFRLKNLLRPGDLSATSQPMPEDTGIAFLVEKMKNMIGSFRRQNGEGYRYGYGFAVGWHGISTSRGVPDWGSATITVLRDGSVIISSGIVEFGQGTHTAIKQVVAEVLGIPYEIVKIEGGTSTAPDTGATHGSRGLTIGGSAALVAAGKIRRRVVRVAAEMLEASPHDIEIADGKVTVKGVHNKLLEWKDVIAACYARGVDLTASGYFFLRKGKFDESRGQGHAYSVYSFSAVLVEVRVDVETGKVEVTRVWPGAACGKIINPAIAMGQIHGSIVQSIGYSLMEQIAFEEGRLLNASFVDYLIPSATETPLIHEPVYHEDICPHGPFGAKGLAELALIPVPAAIANAVKDSVGIDVDSIPIKPEEILKHLRR